MSIFISYRRDDSAAITGRIDDHLRAAFGERDVFRDIDSIPPGVDFVQHLQAALAECDVCIAVIGSEWVSDRLAAPEDFVRIELERLLFRGITIIPVLVDSGELPKPEQIPPSLHPLLRRQAIRVDSGTDFRVQVQRLVHTIQESRERTTVSKVDTHGASAPPVSAPSGASAAEVVESRRARRLRLAAVLVVPVLGVVLLLSLKAKPGTETRDPPPVANGVDGDGSAPAALPASVASSSSAPPATAATSTTAGPSISAPPRRASVLHPELLDPSRATAKAPDRFKVNFATTKGDFAVEVHRDWAPDGADRFYNLVKSGFYDDTRFFRVVAGFTAQFGLSGDPVVNRKWQDAVLADEPVRQSNRRSFVTFATSGPRTRTTQVFINCANNARLDATGFAPFAQVVEGMDVVDKLYGGYGEKPNQGAIQGQGNEYLDAKFPELDRIIRAETAGR